MAEVLHIRNLGLRLSADFAVVVEQLDMTPGTWRVMDAPSGAGKSTALGLISAGLVDSNLPGRIHRLNGRDIVALADRAILAPPDAMGFVLQTNTLVPYLSARDNIRLPVRIAAQPVDPAWETHVVTSLGIAPLLDRRPRALSVGQRQRVSVARAMIGKPALLLLDEPVASLDPGNVEKVEALITQLATDAGSAVLLASHQAQSGVFAHTPRVTHRVVAHQGTTYSLFSDAPNGADAA